MPENESNWNYSDPARSLQDLRAFVEDEAKQAIAWYWRQKEGRKKLSRAIHSLALALTAAAGLVPIVIQVIRSLDSTRLQGFDSGPIASFLVGLAAAILGLDKAFGYSRGWIRYVLTATSMNKVIQEFRMDWVALLAASASPPTAEQQSALINRAKDFISAVQGSVLEETKEWATEFQSNTAQMEKDLKSQLDDLKAKVDKADKEREAASRLGAIELTIENADKTDGFRFDIVLEGKPGKVSDSVSNSKVWTSINTTPEQYKATVNAKANGHPISTSTVVTVKPGETVKPSVALPIP